MKDIDQTALSVLSLNQNFLETLQNSLYIYIYIYIYICAFGENGSSFARGII